MTLHSFSLGIAATIAATLVACGGSASTENGNPAAPPPARDDAGAPVDTDAAPPSPPVDHGAPSDTYPAFKPNVPQLMKGGGGILKNPKIVTITFPGDDNADALEAFDDAIGGTKYWSTVTSEYGVGASVSGAPNHIRMTSPLKDKMDDNALDTWVDVQVTGKSAGGFEPDATKWPAPDDNTVYMIFIPQSANFLISNDDGTTTAACDSGTGGYHTSSQGNNVYAVVPECPYNGESAFDTSTESASHELAEASLDPNSYNGWVGIDRDHAVWDVAVGQQDENGDLCEFDDNATYKEAESNFAYRVQRQWSNASIAAGHDPCVPAAPGPYFNTTPLGDLDTIAMLGKSTTKGLKVAVGETKTLPIGFYSDAAMDAWDISVVEGNPLAEAFGVTPTNNLALSVDKASGKNGEKAVVSVTMRSAPASGTSAPYFTVVSKANGVSHYTFVAVNTQ